MVLTKKRGQSGRCDFRGITRKSIKRVTKLTKSFDLFDLKYTVPKRMDLAVGLVYFNCVKSKRLLMNYLYVLEKFKMAGIPTYTIEMYEDTPEIHDAIHVRTDFILFQKERLCHVLEKHIPKSFTKLLFIDCDLIFDNLNWYDDISAKLDDVNIVQPFSKGIWLDITYKHIVKVRVPFAFYKKLGKISSEGGIGGYHPGFAWAFQRDWFVEHGFFQESILGDGDTLSSTIWLDYNDFVYRPYLVNAVQDYKARLKELPSVCFIEGNIYHLWHGDGKKRQYRERREIFKHVADVRDIITKDKNGLYTIEDKSIRRKIRKYFFKRDDDGLAVEA